MVPLWRNPYFIGGLLVNVLLGMLFQRAYPDQPLPSWRWGIYLPVILVSCVLAELYCIEKEKGRHARKAVEQYLWQTLLDLFRRKP